MPTPKSDADRALARFWRGYADAGPGSGRYILRNPREAAQALLAIQKLTVVFPPPLSESPGGRMLADAFHQPGPAGLPARWWSFSALAIPDDLPESLKTPEAKRLRYNRRLAESRNIITRQPHAGERGRLVEMADHRDRHHPNPQYREADPCNQDLLEYDLWILTEDHAGAPLHLAVAATDGMFAALRYFRTLGDGHSHTLSRYAAHWAVVEALAERGVRWLVDNQPPGAQTNGVRHFQRIVGYRHVRIRRPGRRPLFADVITQHAA